MEKTDSMMLTVLLIVIAILVFIAIREFWAWYLKTNKLIENQEKQLKEQKKQTVILEELLQSLTDSSSSNSEIEKQENEIDVPLEEIETIQSSEEIVKGENKVKCLECKWEGDIEELAIMDDRMGKFEVCPKCSSARWDDI